MLRALRADPRPLYRPVHPVWSAPLFSALLPTVAADFLVRVLGVDAYRVDRVPSEQPAA
jgi:hypothetical protein